MPVIGHLRVVSILVNTINITVSVCRVSDNLHLMMSAHVQLNQLYITACGASFLIAAHVA